MPLQKDQGLAFSDIDCAAKFGYDFVVQGNDLLGGASLYNIWTGPDLIGSGQRWGLSLLKGSSTGVHIAELMGGR
jgi:hypothetical protein